MFEDVYKRQAPVLVDQNLGIAVDYVDLERRTKTPTIIKGAMARRIVSCLLYTSRCV